MSKIAAKNRPMATMRRIRSRRRTVKAMLAPGVLVLTDDGLLGRVRRLVEVPRGKSPAQIEVDDLDGGVELVSSQDIRLVYGFLNGRLMSGDML